MMVWNNLPLLPGNCLYIFTSHSLSDCFPISHLPQIKAVIQNASDRLIKPIIMLSYICPIRMAHPHRRGNLFRNKPFGNLRTAKAVCRQRKNVLYNLRFFLVDYHSILLFRASLIPKGNHPRYIFSIGFFTLMRGLNLDRQIFAV